MSDNQMYIGKLKAVPSLEGESLFELIKRVHDEEGFEFDPEYTDKTTYFDAFDEKYFVVAKVLYKVIELDEMEPEDAFIEMNKNDDGSISFITRYYNGGTCLSEMVEEGLKDLK